MSRSHYYCHNSNNYNDKCPGDISYHHVSPNFNGDYDFDKIFHKEPQVTPSNPITTSTTLAGPVQTTPDPSQLNYISTPVIVAIVLGVCIVIVLSLFVYMHMRRHHRRTMANVKGDVANFNLSPSFGVLGTTDHDTIAKTIVDQTTIAQRQIFAIPGHLLMSLDDDLRVRDSLTAGGGGDIMLAELLSSTSTSANLTQVVVKFLRKDQNVDDVAVKAIWQQEISILWSFHGARNIAKLIGYIENPMGIVLKRYICSLHEDIHGSQNNLTLQRTFGFAIDIANGMTGAPRRRSSPF